MSGYQTISASELSAGYGKKVIVDGLSFEVGAGEVMTLIGPNGAGKSTVLRTISAQLPAISGEVFAGDKRLSDMTTTDIARRFSVLLTDRLSAEQMTCGDVVSTGRYPYTGRLGILSEVDKQVVSEAMELTAVTHLRDTDFYRISDGQRQCVMLARALAQQPEILILDEPTSFLDISNKLRLLTLVRRLSRERKIAVIQSLHELDLAQKFSDKLLCVRNGRAERIGTPEEIFSGSYIPELYGIDTGSYDTLFGTAESERVPGEPQVFVIGGGGAGIPVYRQLNREGLPFAAGVIHRNDLDFPVAAALAAETVFEQPFEPISEEAVSRAKSLIDRCCRVICTAERFGTMNEGNGRLLEYARAVKKI